MSLFGVSKNYLVAALFLLISIGGALPVCADQSKATDERLNQLLKAAISSTLLPAGRKPMIDSVSCVAFRDFDLASNFDASRIPIDIRHLGSMLHHLDPIHSARLMSIIPEEFSWWLRMAGRVGAISIGLAVHETTHAVNNRLRICDAGSYAFFYKGIIYKSSLKVSDLPNISIVGTNRDDAYLGNLSTLRYQAYVTDSSVRVGNDFSILLDELVSYTAGAAIEIDMLGIFFDAGLIPDELKVLDGDFGGMIDMFIISEAYLLEVKKSNPSAYEKIAKQVELMCLLAKLKTDARKNVVKADRLVKKSKVGFTFGLERKSAIAMADLDSGDALNADRMDSQIDRISTKNCS